jgi:phospholipase C
MLQENRSFDHYFGSLNAYRQSQACAMANTSAGGPLDMCDFDVTGFRLPNFVVSPFARPNYVDHQNMDTTAILKFIEMRFSLEPLTQRDAGQPDITTMFDFTNAPNMNPPTPPSQPTDGACYINACPNAPVSDL